MSDSVRAQVEALPYVRWVGYYQPAYRLEEFMVNNLHDANHMYPLQRYNIQVLAVEPSGKRRAGEIVVRYPSKLCMITTSGVGCDRAKLTRDRKSWRRGIKDRGAFGKILQQKRQPRLFSWR